MVPVLLIGGKWDGEVRSVQAIDGVPIDRKIRVPVCLEVSPVFERADKSTTYPSFEVYIIQEMRAGYERDRNPRGQSRWIATHHEVDPSTENVFDLLLSGYAEKSARLRV